MNKTVVGVVGVLVIGAVVACLGLVAIGMVAEPQQPIPQEWASEPTVTAVPPTTAPPTTAPPTKAPPTRVPPTAKPSCRTIAGTRFAPSFEGGCEAWLQNNAMLVYYNGDVYIGFVIDVMSANAGLAGEDMVYLAFAFGVPLDAIEQVSDQLERAQIGAFEGQAAGWMWEVDADINEGTLSVYFGDASYNPGNGA